MHKGLNRALIGLVGLVLLVLGGSVFVIGLGSGSPSWWIHQGSHDVLLTRHERTRWRADGWWWPVVIAVLAVLLLLALWWLSSVVRRHRLSELLVDTRDGEGALLRGRALEVAVADEAEALHGVSRADVTLTGRRREPRTRVRLRLEPHAVPGEALHRLAAETLATARDAAGLARLPAVVQFRAVRHRARRVL